MTAAWVPSLRLPAFPSEALVSPPACLLFSTQKSHQTTMLFREEVSVLWGLEPKPRRLVLREAEGSIWAFFSQGDICLDKRVMGRL